MSCLHTGSRVLAVLLGLFCAWPLDVAAQKRNQKRAADEPVIIEHADHLIYDQFEHPDAQRASGHVVFLHAGMRMLCDSAVYFQTTKSFEAFGHVRVTQGDTLSLKGDRLYYDGMTQTSYIRSRTGEVEARHRQQYLYSDSLFYDAANKFLTYNTGGKLVDGDNVLTSNYGEYFTDTRQAMFRYQVRLVNTKEELVTDELHYNTRTKEARVVGKSNIFSGDYSIFTTKGNYQTQEDVVELFERSILDNPERQLHVEADRVYYEKKSGYLKATGNVVAVDHRNKAMMQGEHCEYYENKEMRVDSSFVTGRAFVKDYSNGKDTLYVHADTLKMFSYEVKTDSAYRLLKGYYHARAFRSDVQAVSDSLLYNTRARVLSLYRDPIVWSDERQVLGERIYVFMNDSTVDSVYVENQALLVERLDSVHYNQVSSREMHGYFERGEMRLAVAEGNACMIMFPLEQDSTILYQNYAESARMHVTMKFRKIWRAWTPAVEGTLYPVGSAPREKSYLPNYAWFDYIRPRDKDDIFEWRPKKQGMELKNTPRRRAPLQNIRKD